MDYKEFNYQTINNQIYVEVFIEILNIKTNEKVEISKSLYWGELSSQDDEELLVFILEEKYTTNRREDLFNEALKIETNNYKYEDTEDVFLLRVTNLRTDKVLLDEIKDWISPFFIVKIQEKLQ